MENNLAVCNSYKEVYIYIHLSLFFMANFQFGAYTPIKVYAIMVFSSYQVNNKATIMYLMKCFSNLLGLVPHIQGMKHL